MVESLGGCPHCVVASQVGMVKGTSEMTKTNDPDLPEEATFNHVGKATFDHLHCERPPWTPSSLDVGSESACPCGGVTVRIEQNDSTFAIGVTPAGENVHGVLSGERVGA